jgi:D-3-phosphoglycerate dehydrogenase / 2-oxoglutarate reductase
MSGPVHVVVLDPIHGQALDELRREHKVSVRTLLEQRDVPAAVADAEVAVVRSGVRITADAVRAAPSLRVIVRAGSGTDNIDLGACREAGVAVYTIPGISAGAVAELAVGLMLAVRRRIALADRQVRAGVWNKPALAGPELAGARLGLVGLGAIGSRIAVLGQAFGMTVAASVQRPGPERAAECAGRGIDLRSLDELLAESDVLCLAVPLAPDTRGLIGAAEFDRMKPGAYLVNVARGGVVDESALRAALTAGHLAGAGLDVHAVEGGVHALADLDNVVLTPHIGATTDTAQQRVGQALVERLGLILSGGGAPDRVL